MANVGVVALNAGFDIGSENCFIAVTKGGGIELLLNDYSQRSTPAYVALGSRQRELGVSAKQKQLMNIQTTFYALKRLIGRQYNDVLNTENLPFPIEAGEHGDAIVRVNHNDEEYVFSVTQLLAMLLTKLRSIAENSVDCVLNCPAYFTDAQRRALVDAAVIAGLNPLRILPDLTAAGIYYGFYRAHASPDINLALIDCGHTTTQVSVIQYKNKNGVGTMTVLAVESDPNLGGKNFDEVLADYFIHQHKLSLNKRSKLRLLAECEKLKKQMSANNNRLPINVECLYEDRDFSSAMDRGLFEELAAPLFQRIHSMFKTALERAHEKYLISQKADEKPVDFKIDVVEIIGGSSRVAAIKKIAKDVFGQEPTATLNADEAVARGCALQCAMLSPTCKVREFQVTDFAPYPIFCKYWFESPDGQEPKVYELNIFPRGHQYPFTKKITLSCSTLPLVFELEYVNEQQQKAPIGQWRVTSPEPLSLHKNKLQLLVRLDASGIAYLSSASLQIEDKSIPNGAAKEAEEPMETEQQSKDNVSTDSKGSNASNNGNSEPPKPKITSVPLTVVPQWIRGQLPEKELQAQKELEYNLVLSDKNWKERVDARNELEEFVYEWRSKMEDGRYDQFIKQSDKQAFSKDLSAMEQWLYEEEGTGDIQSKAVYVEKLDSLRSRYSNNLLFRVKEFESRESLLERLGSALQLANKLLASKTSAEKEEGLSLDEKRISKLETELSDKSKWFEESHGYFSSLVLTDDPKITTKEIREKTDQLENATRPVVDDLQRKREEKRRKEEEAKKAAEAAANNPGGEGDQQSEENNIPREASQQPMDVEPQPTS